MSASYALCWSGGKDSTLALDRALRQGLRVERLFNLYDAESGRVAFHGVRAALIRRRAEHLGLGILQLATPPGKFERTFLDLGASSFEGRIPPPAVGGRRRMLVGANRRW